MENVLNSYSGANVTLGNTIIYNVQLPASFGSAAASTSQLPSFVLTIRSSTAMMNPALLKSLFGAASPSLDSEQEQEGHYC